ncbi:MAG: hypothetical protein R3D89_07005 [Sphingomonadaceae bacterium]|jgi:hypothetical protein
MKLLRWAVAGASVYAVYKYSIGKGAKGEDVIVTTESEIEKLTADEEAETKGKAKKDAAKSK